MNKLQAKTWCKKFVKQWPLLGVVNKQVPSPIGWEWIEHHSGLNLSKGEVILSDIKNPFNIIIEHDVGELSKPELDEKYKVLIAGFDSAIFQAAMSGANEKTIFVTQEVFTDLVKHHPKFKNCFSDSKFVVDGVEVKVVDENLITLSEFLITHTDCVKEFFKKQDKRFDLDFIMELISDSNKGE